jgi:hypothetical protein
VGKSGNAAIDGKERGYPLLSRLMSLKPRNRASVDNGEVAKNQYWFNWFLIGIATFNCRFWQSLLYTKAFRIGKLGQS